MLKERLAALGEVSAGIAHEIRNPLGVIAGYGRLLLKSLGETDSRREVVQKILDEVEEMNRVIEELSKFSRTEKLQKTDLDLSATVREAIEALGDEGRKVQASFTEPITIKGDEALVKQAIRNLMQNAIDAGGQVWVNAQKTSVGGRGGGSLKSWPLAKNPSIDGWTRTRNWQSTGHSFEDLFRKQAHVRSAEVEELLGLVSDPLQGPGSSTGMLTNADFKFKPVKDPAGNNLELTQGTYHNIKGTLLHPLRSAHISHAWDLKQRTDYASKSQIGCSGRLAPHHGARDRQIGHFSGRPGQG